MPDAAAPTDPTPLGASFWDAYVRKQVVAQLPFASLPAAATEGRMFADTTNDRMLIDTGSAFVRGAAWSSAGRTGLSISRVANQSIGTASDTAISFDTEAVDSDGFITVTSDTITIPSGLGGIYAITATVAWASSPGATSNARIEIGGVTGDYRTTVQDSSVGFQNQLVGVPGIALSPTNTVKLRVYQATGSSINVTATLQMWRLHA